MSGLPGVRHADPCTCERCCRKTAFGAIRRAAEVARQQDADANRLKGTLLFDDDARMARYASNVIRRAIRDAIGSPKA